jgi:hypothetical protein
MGKLIQLFPTNNIADLYALGLKVPVSEGAKFIDHGEALDQTAGLDGLCKS